MVARSLESFCTPLTGPTRSRWAVNITGTCNKILIEPMNHIKKPAAGRALSRNPTLTLLFILLPGFWIAALPCTTFVLRTKDALVFGRNLDWYTGTGLIIANPRGLEKEALPNPGETPMKWTSRFGSITFNQVGRELPYGGMNEAGLVVEEMSLDETVYPTRDARPAVNACQWIQFQLDRHATVVEVLESDAELRIVDGVSKFHFLVCDRSGSAAAIEFIDGRMKIHTGSALPVEVLANSTFRSSMEHLTAGGPTENRSLSNFATAAAGVSKERVNAITNPVDHAFVTLQAVAQGLATKWSIVYDLTNRRIHFKVFETPTLDSGRMIFIKPPGAAKANVVDLGAFDFDCAKPAKIFNLDQCEGGPIGGRFQDFTPAKNRQSIAVAFEYLHRMGVLPEIATGTIDQLAAYPDSFPCAGAK